MSLSENLVQEFAELANNNTSNKAKESVYGTIRDRDGTFYVQLDGSELYTPITRTVDVKDNDRVTVSIKQHSAIVTGNLSDKSVNRNSDIFDTLVTFTSLENGTTTIDGGCIKTGKIEADRIDADKLCLTGSINIGNGAFVVNQYGAVTWGPNSSPMKARYNIDGIDKEESDWDYTYKPEYFYVQYSYDGGATWTESIKIQGEDGADGKDGVNGSSANVTFNNIKRALQQVHDTQKNFITADSLGSPYIYGARICAGDDDTTFVTMDDEGLKIYHSSISTPKAHLHTTSDGKSIYLRLGAGDSTTGNGYFQIEKWEDGASMYYYLNGWTKETAGFKFDDDGNIHVSGNLNLDGTNLTVTATFA